MPLPTEQGVSELVLVLPTRTDEQLLAGRDTYGSDTITIRNRS